MKKKWIYLIVFLILLAVEFFIGIFVHDRFIRPYVGDVIVVVVLYFLIRCISPEKPTFLCLWIFLFAVFVEVTQVFPLVDLLGIRNRFLRVVMGTSFSWNDMIAYLAGSIVNLIMDLKIFRDVTTRGGKGK